MFLNAESKRLQKFWKNPGKNPVKVPDNKIILSYLNQTFSKAIWLKIRKSENLGKKLQESGDRINFPENLIIIS